MTESKGLAVTPVDDDATQQDESTDPGIHVDDTEAAAQVSVTRKDASSEAVAHSETADAVPADVAPATDAAAIDAARTDVAQTETEAGTEAEPVEAAAAGTAKAPVDSGSAAGQAAAAQAASPGEQTPEQAGEEAAAGYRLRRAPRYGAFGATGIVIGILVGAVLALSFQATEDYSARTILGYFVAIFGLFGVLLGCGAAVLFDRLKD